MDHEVIERCLRDACNAPALCKLNALARELTGVGLLAVWSRGEDCGQVPVCGSERETPQFCRLLHEMPQGLRRCITCHSMLAMAARSRGEVIQRRCHGGAFVVAAPATVESLAPQVEVVVISSCAFTLPDRKQGWRVTRKIAADLGIDLRRLRRAFAELPELHGEKLKVVGEIVDAAAASLTEALRGRLPAGNGAVGETPPHGIEDTLGEALRATRDPAVRRAAGPAQQTVVDVVRAVVGANPDMPVTVADIARAAHITPNHFSLIFRRQTGTTFSDFLAEKRLERASERLANLTLSIAQVAHQAGFSNANYFAKVFHRHTGMSPRAWRQRGATKP